MLVACPGVTPLWCNRGPVGLRSYRVAIKRPFFPNHLLPLADCAKDGGEEFFTKMHCVRIANP